MKLASFVPVVTASFVDRSDYTFGQYLNEFGKSYAGNELAERQAIFEVELAEVNKHNEEYKAGKHTWWAAVNLMSDFMEHEWASIKTGKAVHHVKNHPFAHHLTSSQSSNPSRKDWREEGVVTPVKDQGQCGSCWSFSATGAMEGSYQIASGQLVSLAEQQYVDCDTTDGNQGCSGGWPYAAMTYASKNGACSESSYAYRATAGYCAQSSCTLSLQPGTVTGYMSVGLTTSALMSALNSQPVSVTVNAEGSVFQSYSGGVITTPCYGSIDHAVLATGYATYSDGTPYWRVKNSWGTWWGDAGYFNLERGVGSYGAACVLQQPPSIAVVSASPSPTPPPSPTPTPPPSPVPTPSPSPSANCPSDSDLVVTDDGRDECLWTSGAHGLTIPPTATEYCEYISDGYFGYSFEGNYDCAESALLSGNFCLWEDGQRGVTIPSGATADCSHLSEGRIGMVLPTEPAESAV